jgi:hypothetical protein
MGLLEPCRLYGVSAVSEDAQCSVRWYPLGKERLLVRIDSEKNSVAIATGPVVTVYYMIPVLEMMVHHTVVLVVKEAHSPIQVIRLLLHDVLEVGQMIPGPLKTIEVVTDVQGHYPAPSMNSYPFLLDQPR